MGSLALPSAWLRHCSSRFSPPIAVFAASLLLKFRGFQFAKPV
jgi:hypothetical protein